MGVKKIMLLIGLAFITLQGASQEQVVSKFDNRFTFKLSQNNNFLHYEQTQGASRFTSNRPLDIGVGFGYKSLFLGLTFSIPEMYDATGVKSESFDVHGNCFLSDFAALSGYVKYYQGFRSESAFQADLQILSLGFHGEYILNRNHSPRSVYNLDRRQSASNGSFLVGAGVYFTAIDLAGDDLKLYHEGKEWSFGPTFGYSYTWIIRNNFFVNLTGMAGINGIKNDDSFALGMNVMPKLSIGYHGGDWSVNIFSDATLLLNGIARDNGYTLTSGVIGVGFARRI